MCCVDAGWEASGRLKGTMNVGGKQQSSAFFLDIDPLAAAAVDSKPDDAADASTTAPAAQAAAPAAPAKRYTCFLAS